MDIYYHQDELARGVWAGRVSAAVFGSTEDDSAQPATMVMVVVRRGAASFF